MLVSLHPTSHAYMTLYSYMIGICPYTTKRWEKEMPPKNLAFHLQHRPLDGGMEKNCCFPPAGITMVSLLSPCLGFANYRPLLRLIFL